MKGCDKGYRRTARWKGCVSAGCGSRAVAQRRVAQRGMVGLCARSFRALPGLHSPSTSVCSATQKLSEPHIIGLFSGGFVT